VRVLIFHGYLLRGTGSNVYNANLAAALLRLGHEVDLLCQERHARELEFVGAVGEWRRGGLELERVRASGCTVYRPEIGDLLPVYVADRYEGIDARPFPQLTDAQLDAYLQANVGAVADVIARTSPDVALANHLVMGPAVLARALHGSGIPYAVTIHGSALEYTVKPHPRFLPYAREGIAPASGVLVGSRHTAESLWGALEDPSLADKTRLGPPGVDIETFAPRERTAALAGLRALADRSRSGQGSSERSRGAGDAPAASAFNRDATDTAGAVAELAALAPSGPLVAFVGKLIVSKGIDLLLAAWPLVLAQAPAATLAIVGFGAYRPAAEQLVHALSRGDVEEVRALAASGRAAEGGPRSRLHFLLCFLERLKRASEAQRARYLTAASRMQERVIFTGRLEHEELADLLPACEAMVVPSTFPESFGMVALEAAACGALPISAAHSGLAEVSRALAQALPPPTRELVSFPLGSGAVDAIASSLLSWLDAPAQLRAQTRAALVGTVVARFSWEGVARGAVAAARGELDALQAPS